MLLQSNLCHQATHERKNSKFSLISEHLWIVCIGQHYGEKNVSQKITRFLQAICNGSSSFIIFQNDMSEEFCILFARLFNVFKKVLNAIMRKHSKGGEEFSMMNTIL